MKTTSTTIACRFLVALGVAVSPSAGFAQVVINVPPTVIDDNYVVNTGETLNVSDGGEVGGRLTADSGSVVNILGGNVGWLFWAAPGSMVNISGGRVSHSAGASSGSVVNITGGELDTFFRAGSGSEVHISGGTVGTSFTAQPGSMVNISGGTVGTFFEAHSGSDVELMGGEFLLNGVAYEGNVVMPNTGDVLSGTLSDGSTFVFTSLAGDELEQSLTLTQAILPAIEVRPMALNGPITDGPIGLRNGQTLRVQAGGELPENFTVVDATLNVEDGTVGKGVEVVGGTVNVTGGIVGVAPRGAGNSAIFAYSGSEVYVSNGIVGSISANSGSTVSVSGGLLNGGDYSGIRSRNGSVVNISGGTVDAGPLHSVSAELDGQVNVTGGSIGPRFRAAAGSDVNITGATFGRYFEALPGSNVELTGGEYHLNGVEYKGDSITLDSGDLFTGTLADGSSFVFNRVFFDTDRLEGTALTRVTLPAADPMPTIADSPGVGPAGLRAGQELTVRVGGQLRENFAVVDATLNVEGGEVGDGIEVAGGTLNISGGNLGDGLAAFEGSVVNISGGTVENVMAFTGSEVNLMGTEFFIDGVPLRTLVPGQAFGITDRDATLSGLLADGSSFDFELLDEYPFHDVHFALIAPNATLTVTLAVPEPASFSILTLACCLLLGGQRRKSHLDYPFLGRRGGWHSTP